MSQSSRQHITPSTMARTCASSSAASMTSGSNILGGGGGGTSSGSGFLLLILPNAIMIVRYAAVCLLYSLVNQHEMCRKFWCAREIALQIYQYQLSKSGCAESKSDAVGGKAVQFPLATRHSCRHFALLHSFASQDRFSSKIRFLLESNKSSTVLLDVVHGTGKFFWRVESWMAWHGTMDTSLGLARHNGSTEALLVLPLQHRRFQ